MKLKFSSKIKNVITLKPIWQKNRFLINLSKNDEEGLLIMELKFVLEKSQKPLQKSRKCENIIYCNTQYTHCDRGSLRTRQMEALVFLYIKFGQLIVQRLPRFWITFILHFGLEYRNENLGRFRKDALEKLFRCFCLKKINFWIENFDW